MAEADKSKRTLFKKMVATLSFVSLSGYLSNLISSRTYSIDKINENSTNDVKNQKKVWLQKKWVPMTDNEKKQMLDTIVNIHNKHNKSEI